MMRCKNGLLLLLCVAMCVIYSFPAFASVRILGSIYLEDSNPADNIQADTITDATDSDADVFVSADPEESMEEVEEEMEEDVASDSDAASGFDDDIMLLADQSVYESGSISSTIVNYMSDVVPKLGAVHYVLFRAGQYDYRLYYSRDLELSDSGEFSASDVEYVNYNSRYYTWNYGSETDFSLDPGGYMVYSDLGGYPSLDSSGAAAWILVFLGATYFLFILFRSFFAPHSYQL